MEKKYDKYSLKEKAKVAVESLNYEEVAEKAKLKKQWDSKRKFYVQPTALYFHITPRP